MGQKEYIQFKGICWALAEVCALFNVVLDLVERMWRYHVHCQPELELEEKEDLRAGKGHQSAADHNEVQDVPQITKIRARVEEQSQVDHLQS